MMSYYASTPTPCSRNTWRPVDVARGWWKYICLLHIRLFIGTHMLNNYNKATHKALFKSVNHNKQKFIYAFWFFITNTTISYYLPYLYLDLDWMDNNSMSWFKEVCVWFWMKYHTQVKMVYFMELKVKIPTVICDRMVTLMDAAYLPLSFCSLLI